MISVGIVAAARAMRVGLRDVLENLPGLTIVSEAPSMDQMSASEADILVVASPADFGSTEITCAILLLTDDPADVKELLNAKFPAWGALPVDASEDELLAAIHALAQGLWVGAPVLLDNLLVRQPRLEMNDDFLASQSLTMRETEVLQLTAQGFANKQIAIQLKISEHTVKFHLSSLYAKLGVTNRTEAVRAGARSGLIVF